ncbi:allantoinase [Microbacterium proteolyticum]|nr:allantoinase [Microbacterium sp. SORGH_AS_0344]MDQ1168682.1 allantoinase [Microbacterium proteolyticum]
MTVTSVKRVAHSVNAMSTRIAARRVYLDGAFAPATVVIDDGVISAVEAFDAAADTVLPGDAVLLPGLVDSHVHLDEPGRTEWEGFLTGTAAAAAGGVTTVVDMPLNSSPVTTTVDALDAKRAAAAGKLAVDVAYWGGAVPENLGSLRALADAGVVGFKCFLSPSGIDEFGHLDAEQLERCLAELAAFDGLLIVHAEDPAHLHADGELGPRYSDFEASRPPESERAAIQRVIEAARRTGARAHIVHVSDGGALDDVRAAKAEGVRLTIETCPHYLTLDASAVPDGAGAFKCCPPIRGGDNRDLLWAGVVDGTVDAIVSDHSPATVELKGNPDFGLAWGGIAGLQTGLSAVHSTARARGLSFESLLPLMTTGPARIAGLEGLGVIAAGAPAHLVAFAPEEEFVVDAATLEYRNPVTPWHGQTLTGVVRETWLRGESVYRRGAPVTEREGREILRAAAAVEA